MEHCLQDRIFSSPFLSLPQLLGRQIPTFGMLKGLCKDLLLSAANLQPSTERASRLIGSCEPYGLRAYASSFLDKTPTVLSLSRLEGIVQCLIQSDSRFWIEVAAREPSILARRHFNRQAHSFIHFTHPHRFVLGFTVFLLILAVCSQYCELVVSEHQTNTMTGEQMRQALPRTCILHLGSLCWMRAHPQGYASALTGKTKVLRALLIYSTGP